MGLKEYRKSKGLTQAQFAESVKDIIDLTVPMVSMIETGKLAAPESLMAYIGYEEEEAELTQTEEIVLEACVRASQKNPITRSDLKDLTGLTDRKAREVVESLRDKGYRIVSNLGGVRGYWYGTPEEYKQWLRQYLSYANTIYRRKAAMDRRTEGQVSIWTKEKTGATSS